jgi:hypothetical protein
MNTTTPPEPGKPAPKPAAADQPAQPLELMTRHRVLFAHARAHIEKLLGKAPDEDDLMRLWLATATPWDVARVFESAVLDLGGSDLLPVPGDDYNQTLLNL